MRWPLLGRILGSMKLLVPTLLALLAGAAIAAQASANARLGVLLGNPGAATGFAFLAGFVVVVVSQVLVRAPLPEAAAAAAVPAPIWLLGGLLGAFGVGVFYRLIPELGVGRVIGLSLVGQLLFSLCASHFGWFDLPTIPIDRSRGVGAILLLAGVAILQGGDA